MSEAVIDAVVSTTKEYYDGPADVIYRTIWGDDVHLGLFEGGTTDLPTAAARTNEVMANEVRLGPRSRVLDLGCGYGSTARYLASRYGCSVVGTNISEKELALARERSARAGLDGLLSFEYGDFHNIGYPRGRFDVVWSQESFLHGVDKRKILSECHRVLKRGGSLVFTDVLVRHGTPRADRERIYARVGSPDMWDRGDYVWALRRLGFSLKRVADWSPNVARSYGWVRDRIQENRTALLQQIEEETVERTLAALGFWVESARAGKIGWGLFVANR